MQKPSWLTIPAPKAEDIDRIQAMLDQGGLHTVCASAQCPNIGECFAARTCTFMILGDICTRNCPFCAVQHGRPGLVDPSEPAQLAETARKLGLRHVVITSVTRDDLPDGGSRHFAATVQAIREVLPETTTEVLIPDFRGHPDLLEIVMESRPTIINHNIETVPSLYPTARPQALYSRSLELIRRVSASGTGIITKTGLMLGLGETLAELEHTMRALRTVGCQILTIGQYLQPSPSHLPVVEYVDPEVFQALEELGYELGFTQVVSGPLVRSSYHAAQCFEDMQRPTS